MPRNLRAQKDYVTKAGVTSYRVKFIERERRRTRRSTEKAAAKESVFCPLQLKLLDEYPEAEEAMEEAYEDRFHHIDRASKSFKERNERQAVLEALPDLIRLDRYERRAWSRQRRAIRSFMRIKSTRDLGSHGSADLAITGNAAGSEKGSEIRSVV